MIHRPARRILHRRAPRVFSWRALLWLALLAAPQGAATAGPWPREEGRSFISVGSAILDTGSGGTQAEQTLYFEYGLKRQRTLGFSGSANLSVSGEGHVFLRFAPLARPSGALLAFELGAGAKSIDLATVQPFVKTGLSWGKGLTFGARQGWASIDGAALFGLGHDDSRLKIDATLGVNMGARFKLIGQGFAEITRAGQSLSLAPSLVYTPKRGAVSYQFGAEGKFGSDARTGLRVNIWAAF